MSEYLDVVDEDDRVIGRDTRENVHRDYRIHRGVHILVAGRDGRILVQRRAKSLDCYPGYFDASAGGQVASGEGYHEAASRELHEELGCHYGPLVRVADYDGFSVRQREKRRVFLHTCDGPFHPDPGAVDSIAFYPADTIVAMLAEHRFTEGFQRSLGLYFDFLAARGVASVPWRWSPSGRPGR